MSRVWAAWPRWRDSPVRDAVLAVVVTAVIVAGAYGEAHPTRVSDEVISGHPVPRELRAILNVLRQADEADPTQPAPGLSQVDALIASASRAGLPTSLRHTGASRPLPAEVEVAAYRIIQESLTNAIRHAGPRTGSRPGWVRPLGGRTCEQLVRSPTHVERQGCAAARIEGAGQDGGATRLCTSPSDVAGRPRRRCRVPVAASG
ncbi:MAG: hypothetical protein ACRDRJ_32315 [Streptosporangiaceae bacterium]